MVIGKDNQGLVLVAVLWMVAVMTAIAAIVGQTSRLNMKMAASAADEVRCKWACRAGTEHAIAVLTEDLRDSDCLLDLWSDNAEDFNDAMLERCRYTVRVTDEAGRLNLNTVTKEQLLALPDMEESIAEALLDWRDTDDEPRAQGVEGGYYETLPIPYRIRNGPVRTVRELLRVKGVTEDLLYGEDTNLDGWLDYNERDGEASPPLDDGDDVLDQGWIAFLTCHSYDKNVDASGNRRININQADQKQLASDLGIKSSQAKWIVDNRGSGFRSIADLISDQSPQSASPGTGGNQEQAEPIDLQTFQQIADRITISGEEKIPGKVNINTAPREVLVALFGGDDSAEQLAQTVMANRSSLASGFTSIADLLNQESMTVARFKAIAEQITVRSDIFTIRCAATADVSGARVQTECVVDRGETPCAVLYWYQGANY
ncbi:MAG: type II secretion system protein GspK [Planctomycetes bacterium]|jgi:type II secretory pathway component PulK|nr:type II secretion system protein GspK [Planctomycetota bacterium]